MVIAEWVNVPNVLFLKDMFIPLVFAQSFATRIVVDVGTRPPLPF